MNEDEYRNMYHQVNPQDCVFKKITLLNYGDCEYGEKIYLAERETMACQAKNCRENCQQLLNSMRNNARFALKLTKANEPLPHSKEVKVQVGGLYGLQQLLNDKNSADIEELSSDFIYKTLSESPIKNIHGVVKDAMTKFGSLKNIPYNQIVKAIIHFSLPSRRKRQKDT